MLHAATSNIHGVIWRDTCDSLIEVIGLILGKQSLFLPRKL